MTNIHPLSDLHLEFSGYKPPTLEADIIVLAGDIHVRTKALPWARENFPNAEIIYVAGNHEFYYSNIHELLNQFREESKEYGIHFLENDELILHDIRFLGCTLWTDYKSSVGLSQELAMDELEMMMPDHGLILANQPSEENRYFSARDALLYHATSVAWLTRKLVDEKSDSPTVVVTHHGPSKHCIHKQFGHTEASGGFYSNHTLLLEQADYWIYGHTHSNLDINVNKTRLISNQRGYPHENLDDFNSNFILTI